MNEFYPPGFFFKAPIIVFKIGSLFCAVTRERVISHVVEIPGKANVPYKSFGEVEGRPFFGDVFFLELSSDVLNASANVSNGVVQVLSDGLLLFERQGGELLQEVTVDNVLDG